MSSTINTSQVAERRQLHFNNLDDILADAEGLAKSGSVRNLGNWSPGQVVQHVAIVMNKSIDGFVWRMPLPLRFIARTFLKRKFLTRPMKPGFKLPSHASAELGPPPTSFEDGLQSLRQAVGRLKTTTNRSAHPAFGQLTAQEWNQIHCRHSEMHLSFLVPRN
jgi:hypothetical protein